MAEFRFRNFSDLAFLQAIDKPRFLAPLLTRYESFCRSKGIEPGQLRNDDPSARMLLDVFARPDEQMPGPLLNDLHMIDGLADDDGHDRILEEADSAATDLSNIDADLGPGDFALAVLLQHPRLIRRCQEKSVCEKVKRYYEYPSSDRRRLSHSDFAHHRTDLETVLSPWFQHRKRTELCEVFVYQEGSEVRLLVTHGGIFRSTGNITRDLRRSRLAFRPQKHDSLIYDTSTGVLKIHAQFQSEREQYRTAVGEVLFGDPGYFPERAPYTLENLRTNGGTLTLVDGMQSIRLTEVAVEHTTDGCHLQKLYGQDLTAAIAGHGTLPLNRGLLVQAAFSIRFSGGGRARRVEVRLPNVAEYDRERDGPVVEAFFRANGFLLPVSDDEQPDHLVAVA